jgi:hypothetical protein
MTTEHTTTPDTDRAQLAENRLWQLVASRIWGPQSDRWLEELNARRRAAYAVELQNGGPVATWSTGDAWADGVIAWHDRADIEPLAAYLQSGPTPSPAQGRDLAELLRTLTAKGKHGGRGGTISRWRDPNYVAAWFAEHRIIALKLKTGSSISDEERKQIVEDEVARIGTWAFAKRKPPTVERVLRLLREPRRNRLPVAGRAPSQDALATVKTPAQIAANVPAGSRTQPGSCGDDDDRQTNSASQTGLGEARLRKNHGQ